MPSWSTVGDGGRDVGSGDDAMRQEDSMDGWAILRQGARAAKVAAVKTDGANKLPRHPEPGWNLWKWSPNKNLIELLYRRISGEVK
jgi:hypothetical protein